MKDQIVKVHPLMRYKVACERCSGLEFKIGVDEENESMTIECVKCGIMDWLCNYKKGQTGDSGKTIKRNTDEK